MARKVFWNGGEKCVSPPLIHATLDRKTSPDQDEYILFTPAELRAFAEKIARATDECSDYDNPDWIGEFIASPEFKKLWSEEI